MVAEITILPLMMWTSGRILTVSFLDGGDDSVIEKVKKLFKEWENYANIKFEFVDKNGDLRVTFKQGSHWSAIGRDAIARPLNKPTMNLGLDNITEDSEYRRVTLHEIGHALGCIHEHQNPIAGIQWNEPEVYRYFQETQGWDRDKTFRNVIERYDKDTTNYSEYDDNSIMVYRIPARLTLDNRPVGNYVTELSQTDKDYMKMWYPN